MLVLEAIELVLVVGVEVDTIAEVVVTAGVLLVVMGCVVLDVVRGVVIALVDEVLGVVEEDEPDFENARYAPAAITAMTMMTITAIAAGASARFVCMAPAHSDWSI